MKSSRIQRKTLLYISSLILLILTATVLGVVANKYRSKYKQAKAEKRESYQEGLKEGLLLARQSVDPLSETPFFIFENTTVSWSVLAPRLEIAYYAGDTNFSIPKIQGTFSIVGAKPESGEVTFDASNVYFSDPGEYYVRSNIGSFKILILDPALSKDDHVFSISAFIARNSCHSMADARLIQPNDFHVNHRPDKALRKFFSTDQPLSFQCGYVVEFTNYILHKMGYNVIRVQLISESGNGHVVSHVYLPIAKKWVAIDSDYGAYLSTTDGTPLAIDEIATLSRSDPSTLRVTDLAQKNWVDNTYNMIMYEYTWTPDKMTNNSCVDPSSYLKMITNYTTKYHQIGYDKHFQWEPAKKYLASGQKIE